MLGSRSTPELELEFEFESSHEQDHPKSTLLSLPHEILDLILAYASLRDLKSLRSACKQFSTFTDPALFHTVIIVPCSASLNLITTLPHHERISRHVKSLIYDDRWPDLSRSIRNNLPIANVGSVNQIAQARLFLTLDHLTQLTRCFKENISNEVAHFKQVLDRLPSLRGVSVFSTHEHDKSAKLPRFYSSICSDILCEINETSLLPHHPQRSGRAQSALLAISQSSVHVTEIYMNGLSWRQMPHSQVQQCFFTRPVFATVRCLELRFGHTQYDLLFCGKTLLARLGHALSQAIHLEVLRLDFGDDTAQDNVDEVEESDDRPWCMLSALFNSEHRSHNLRELDFQNLRFSEAGFITFLDHHASTIKSLRLNSVELVAAPGSRSPCWRRVFIHLQSVLRLHQVQLQDGLYISGGGVWISMHPRPEERFPGCLLDQLEQFILHGGECPIRAGYHDLKQDDLNGLGDESWAFY
jgi:hypothetical protein